MINQDNKNKIVSYSKGLSVASLISIILCCIGIVVIAISMAIIPFITKNISIEGNTLNIFEEKIEFNLTKEEILTIKYNDESVKEFTFEDFGINSLIKIIHNLSATKINLYLETILTISIIEIIIFIIMLIKIRKLFEKISTQKTPFIKEAPEYIRFIAYMIITLIIIDIVGLMISSLIIGTSFSISLNVVQIIFIIGLFLLSFIFRYGYELENQGQ